MPDVQETSWIEKNPGVRGGDPCIRKTRHGVAGLVQWRRMGLTDAQILERHPDLTQADLETAWAYYDQNREEVDQAIRADEES
jgi:uncharacterized protein (DUF433 family)